MSLAAADWGRSSGASFRRRKRGALALHVDVPLLALLAIVAVIGLVVLYSAAAESTSAVMRQSARLAVGFGAFFVLAQVPPRYLRMWTPWLYCIVVGLLLAVMVEGEISKGAQRWLDLGLVRFQPSELMKLAAPMMVAWFLHDRRLPPTFPQLMVLALIVAVPALLIAKQPDLGTALLVVAAGGLTVLLAGISMRVMAFGGVLALIGAPILWSVMHDYQRARV